MTATPNAHPGTPATAPPGHAARGTLPLTTEFARQWSRRRTRVALAAAVVVPLLLTAAFKAAGEQSPGPGEAPDLYELATRGGTNFTLFTLLVSSQLLLVVLVAMFTGDTVASDAGWGSLRYLLTLPVPRRRLLRQKLIVGLAYSLLVTMLIPLTAYVSGTLTFGTRPLTTPLGQSTDTPHSLALLALVDGYIAATMLLVASLAFYFSTRTDAPLAAVGGAVGVVVVSNILDAVTGLGAARDILPGHYFTSWLGAVEIPADYTDMINGLLATVAYTVVLLTLAWRHFDHKDVLS